MQTSTNQVESVFSDLELALVRMIRARAVRGESIEHIADTSRLSYSLVRSLAVRAGIKYKHKRPTEEQIHGAVAAVRNKGMTFRAAGRAFGMSRTAVHRYVTNLRDKSIDSAGEMVFEDGHRMYSPQKQTWHCPKHGKLTVWPCVACAALAAKRPQ